MVEPQLLQGRIEGLADRSRRKVLVPDLCRDMQLVARHAGACDRSPNRFLVAVHLGSVDMAVAERQRALHRGPAGIALQAEGAEPEFWHGNALSLNGFHGYSKQR